MPIKASITDTSTFKEVVDANTVSASDEDLASWNKLTVPYFSLSSSIKNNMYMGVFGVDLLNFFTECAVTTNCDYDFLINKFDGWAFGVYAYVDYD